jgi:hypothetical protein
MIDARAIFVGCATVLAVCSARLGVVYAQDPTAQTDSPTALAPPAQSPILIDGSLGKLMIAGYAEGFYQWNFNRPPSGITNYRGFDNRHNAFTIANAVVDAQYEKAGISARIALQIGHTPNTYYLAEPTSKADLSSSVIGASDAATWRFIQQAILGYKIGLGRGLLVQAGVFLSPIGPESMAVRENWMFSHSDLFFNLPFYHSGVRLTQQLTEAWSATIGVVNGWNSVVDNNSEKSIYGQLYYNRPDRLQASLLYFTGVERNPLDSVRGWRHLIDAWTTLYFGQRFAFSLHGSMGFEPQQTATAMWLAGATYVRLRILPWLQLAARGDVMWERKADLPIFFAGDVSYLASGTGTLEFNVASGLLVRLEYRHDHSDGGAFFTAPSDSALFSGRDVETDRQDTLTVGAAVWF